MIITEVKRDKKHCFKVSTDDGRTVFIDLDVCAEYGLKSGMELDGERLTEIIKRSDFVRAKERALWYLDRTDHSERALYDKLTRAGFAKESCAAVMAWLKEYGMIDDRRYAEHLAERYSESNVSQREAYQKLLLKGVPRELAREVTAETEFDEAAQIRAVIEKKYRNKLDDRASVEKVYAALVRKGFSFGAVRDGLKSYCEELRYMSEE